MRGKRVLDRVEMHVVHVARVIPVIADRVLPEPPLPDAALAPTHPHRGALFIGRNGFREGLLHRPPASGVVIVPCRKVPDAVHVIRQDHPGVNVERRTGSDITDGVAERIDVGDEQFTPAVEQVDGEEVGSSRHSVAAVIWHGTNSAARPGKKKEVGWVTSPV